METNVAVNTLTLTPSQQAALQVGQALIDERNILAEGER